MGNKTLGDVLIKLAPNHKEILKESKIIKFWKGSEQKENDLSYLLLKELNNVYGFELYIISKVLKISILTLCESAFPDLKIEVISDTNVDKTVTPEKKYINQFTVDQKDVAKRAGIIPNRLNKILSGLRTEGFYAFEIISIARSQKFSITKSFDQLYKSRYQKIVLSVKNNND